MRLGKGLATTMAGSTLLMGLAACGSSDTNNSATSGGGAAATAATCNSPGVTASTITIGDLLPLSGAGVTQRAGWDDGVKARFLAVNDAGGVNKRTITLVTDDDKSTASGSLDSGKDLVENKGAFSILEAPLQDGALDYLMAQGVPDVGWSTADVGAKHDNFYSITGAVLPGVASTSIAQFIKDQGGSHVADFTVADPQATTSGQTFIKAAAQVGGLSVDYTRFNVPFVPGDFTADAQAMLSKKIDSATLAITNNVGIALYKAAKQAGVNFKAFVFPNFYDPVAIQQVGADVAGTFTGLNAAPFELNLPETQKFKAAIAKYVPSGKVNLLAMSGWMAADFTIEVLQKLGACPTREGFLSAMKTKTYDGHGAIGTTVQWHQPNLCSWFAKLTATGYQPVGTKPVCGQKVQ
ncbi:MAG TPA: ABC transporter substrate-binding protein [Candidatus Dormibacteraeota bacterium]|jgi:ABC-type branched-subunit amino acid transport system substrate-binding protein|nr:ABC transporter substrate-binding protein [Candidatus Dormibacteraeota bacterium]